jgi:hypothetical protein
MTSTSLATAADYDVATSEHRNVPWLVSFGCSPNPCQINVRISRQRDDIDYRVSLEIARTGYDRLPSTTHKNVITRDEFTRIISVTI